MWAPRALLQPESGGEDVGKEGIRRTQYPPSMGTADFLLGLA